MSETILVIKSMAGKDNSNVLSVFTWMEYGKVRLVSSDCCSRVNE